jgi:predicted PurR-regulated permease PerM
LVSTLLAGICLAKTTLDFAKPKERTAAIIYYGVPNIYGSKLRDWLYAISSSASCAQHRRTGCTKRSRHSGELHLMPREVEFTISWTAIAKLLLAILMAYLLVRLWPLIQLLLLALLIAIAFNPLVHWTYKHRWPHWTAVLMSTLILFGFVALLVTILIPTFTGQGGSLIESLPSLRDQWTAKLPQSGPVLEIANQFLSSPAFGDPVPLLKQFLAVLTVALSGVVQFFLVLIVAIYFIADGPRVYSWLIAFLPRADRRKMDNAAAEIISVVGHYIVGQFITSVLCGLFAFIVLALFHVPNAGFLAIIAAIFDILPLIGFFLFTIPAMAIALTVSPGTALLVGALYGVYHLIENYFIVPKVYGNRLRLSTLTVLISCLAAGLIAGIVGVIIVLPLVASYPVLERYWLRPHLEPDTVEKHVAIDVHEHGAS